MPVLCTRTSCSLTDLLAVLFGFEAHNLQDAGVGDVGDDVCDSLPHSQQRSTQHVVLSQTHAQPALLTLLQLLTLTFPINAHTPSIHSTSMTKNTHFKTPPSPPPHLIHMTSQYIRPRRLNK